MATIDSIGAADYFKDKSTELDTKYDFNKDGTVDIADYRYACLTLNDDDPTNDVKFSQNELDNVFASLIKQDENENGNKAEEITKQNANEMAEKVVAEINKSSNNPQNATSLNNLQQIGANLTKYIAECTTIAKTLALMIDEGKEKLEKLEKEKEAKEREYKDVQDKVEAKSAELDNCIQNILKKTNQLNTQRQQTCTSIISKCVYNYLHGQYPNQSLEQVIANQLAGAEGNFNTAGLQNEINNSTALGLKIKGYCSDLDSIAGSIRNTIIKYNEQNSYVNYCTTNRNNTLSAANKASQSYQTGYAQRNKMRQAIIDKYHVAATDGADATGSGNAQVIALGDFLNDGSNNLTTMPFADAWYVLQKTFDACGLQFTHSESGGYQISVPEGTDTTASNIYSALVKSINENYGQVATLKGYIDTNVTTSTTTATTIEDTDPISFTSGNVRYDFIQDRDNDGIFDDVSEFLGAKNGIEELKAYDTNGDGQISGDELANLKMLGINQENGQYTFTNAKAVGVQSIDLNSYKELNQNQINNDLLIGTFDVNMQNGETIVGQQTEDHGRNLENNYSAVFGEKIENSSADYELNPFMDDFQETVDTNLTVSQTESDIEETQVTSKYEVEQTEHSINRKASNAATDGTYEKKRADRLAEAKEEEKAVSSKGESTKGNNITTNEPSSKKSKKI